jgi:hypothetical protein
VKLECERSPNLFDRVTAHVGTKFLKKHEWEMGCRSHGHRGGAQICRFRRRAVWKTPLIQLQISRGGAKKAAYSVYQPLTVMGKDCGSIGPKQRQCLSGATKTGTIQTPCNDARVRSRNGEQAWP